MTPGQPLPRWNPRITTLLAVLALLLSLPLYVSPFKTVQLTQFLIFGLLAFSLDLIWGYAGIISFGHGAFFGVGGYAYGALAINLIGPAGNTHFALFMGIAIPAAFAALLAYFMFYGRVSDVYAAIITLAVALILHQVLGGTADVKYAFGKARLGGYNGMTGIPSLVFDLPGRRGAELGIVGLYYLVALTLVGLYFLARWLLQSPFGRVLAAIRENEVRAATFGYDVRLYKLAIFTLSGAIAGLSGSYFAAWGNFMNPSVFGLVPAAALIIWVLVGGRGTLVGAVGGAVLVQYITVSLETMISHQTVLILGIILVGMVLLLPQGVAPSVYRLLTSAGGKR